MSIPRWQCIIRLLTLPERVSVSVNIIKPSCRQPFFWPAQCCCTVCCYCLRFATGSSLPSRQKWQREERRGEAALPRRCKCLMLLSLLSQRSVPFPRPAASSSDVRTCVDLSVCLMMERDQGCHKSLFCTLALFPLFLYGYAVVAKRFSVSMFASFQSFHASLFL